MTEPTKNNNVSQPANQPTSLLRSLTRLAIGSTLLGTEILVRQVRQWEEEVAGRSAPTVSPMPDPDDKQNREKVIGLIFESQNRLNQTVGRVRRANNAVLNVADMATRPVRHSRLLSPVRRRYHRLRNRGRASRERIIALGRVEQARSRALAQVATERVYDAAFERLAEEPRVQHLIREQSRGLTESTVNQVRRQSASADSLLEEGLRRLLRRQPVRVSAPPLPGPDTADKDEQDNA